MHDFLIRIGFDTPQQLISYTIRTTDSDAAKSEALSLFNQSYPNATDVVVLLVQALD